MKCGYELELLAPLGETRHSIAHHLGKNYSCQPLAIFHRESDYNPYYIHGKSFYCLTRGFRLESPSGFWLKVVNDMTISTQIDLENDDETDWFHLLADDIRLIDLIVSHCDPGASPQQVLTPIAELFQTTVDKKDTLYQVSGPSGSLVCLAHHHFKDRNRICEIVTAPIETSHREVLYNIIHQVQEKGCTIPTEAAFHIHFDATDFCSSDRLLRLIRYFHVWSEIIKTLVPPNPHCQRLGPYTDEVVRYAFDRANDNKPWDEVVAALKGAGATKFCDFNFANILNGDPNKMTIEVRIIPMTFNVDALVAATVFFNQFLQSVIHTDYDHTSDIFPAEPENIEALITELENWDDEPEDLHDTQPTEDSSQGL